MQTKIKEKDKTMGKNWIYGLEDKSILIKNEQQNNKKVPTRNNYQENINSFK